jgi:hypothetical protein
MSVKRKSLTINEDKNRKLIDIYIDQDIWHRNMRLNFTRLYWMTLLTKIKFSFNQTII